MFIDQCKKKKSLKNKKIMGMFLLTIDIFNTAVFIGPI